MTISVFGHDITRSIALQFAMCILTTHWAKALYFSFVFFNSVFNGRMLFSFSFFCLECLEDNGLEWKMQQNKTRREMNNWTEAIGLDREKPTDGSWERNFHGMIELQADCQRIPDKDSGSGGCFSGNLISKRRRAWKGS